MRTPSLMVTVAHEGRSCVLTITGDLDVLSADTLVSTVTGLVGGLDGQADQVVLDLAGLTFLDIAGARALVAAVQAVPDGHPTTVRSISPIARRLLSVLGWSLGHDGAAELPMECTGVDAAPGQSAKGSQATGPSGWDPDT